jgi:hypothetical protein
VGLDKDEGLISVIVNLYLLFCTEHKMVCHLDKSLSPERTADIHTNLHGGNKFEAQYLYLFPSYETDLNNGES